MRQFVSHDRRGAVLPNGVAKGASLRCSFINSRDSIERMTRVGRSSGGKAQGFETRSRFYVFTSRRGNRTYVTELAVAFLLVHHGSPGL